MLYDIIQIEDDSTFAQHTKLCAEEAGLQFLGVPYMSDLEHALLSHTARYYIVDGRFPRHVNGAIEKLADEAINLIRKAHPEAKIVVYSGSDPEVIAKRTNTEGFSKGMRPDDLVAELGIRIKANH